MKNLEPSLSKEKKMTTKPTNPKEEEWEKEFKIIVGGFCWSEDGGNGGNSWDDIKAFIRNLLASERKRVLEEIGHKVIRIRGVGVLPFKVENPSDYVQRPEILKILVDLRKRLEEK